MAAEICSQRPGHAPGNDDGGQVQSSRQHVALSSALLSSRARSHVFGDDGDSESNVSDMELRQLSRRFTLSQITLQSVSMFDRNSRASSRVTLLNEDDRQQAGTTLIEKLRPYVSLHVIRRLGCTADGVDFATENCPVVDHFKGSVAIVDMS